MAVKLIENLVLRGVRVSDVVTGLVRAGFNPAMAKTDAMSPRHPHGIRDNSHPDTANVSRAGRLERLAGAPSSRSAIKAGQSILSGWSRAVGYSLVEYPACRHQRHWPMAMRPERRQAEPCFTRRLAQATRRLGDRGTR